MKQKRPNYDEPLRTRAVNMFTIRAIVAAYLIYLGVRLIIAYADGSSKLPPVVTWLAGPVFILGGGTFIWYCWRRFRAELKEAELPDPAQEDAES